MSEEELISGPAWEALHVACQNLEIVMSHVLVAFNLTSRVSFKCYHVTCHDSFLMYCCCVVL